MTSDAPVTPPAGSVERPAAAEFATHACAVAAADLRKVARDPTDVFTRAVQPALWLLVFGQIFTRTHAIPTGEITYLEFLAPGVLAQSVLFSGIFYGIAVIWERDLGIIHKLLASPASRGALVAGKALAAGVRSLAQAAIIVVLALVLGVRIRHDPASLLGVVLAVALGGALFATFSLVIACVVRTRERFMGIGQLLTMPLFFASNAIYPLDLMPGWLRVVALANPVTYLVDLLRGLLVPQSAGLGNPAVDVLVLCASLLGLLLTAARLYPSLAR